MLILLIMFLYQQLLKFFHHNLPNVHFLLRLIKQYGRLLPKSA